MSFDGQYRSQFLQRNLPIFCDLLVREVELQRRCDQNRKRSKRRAIYCPIHECHLDSVSPKYRLFADCANQLDQRGVPRKNALLLIATRTAVPLQGEWVEAFWCDQCQQTKWYHVRKGENRTFRVSIAPRNLWQYVTRAIDLEGNPSVGQFTRKNARMVGNAGIKNFKFV